MSNQNPYSGTPESYLTADKLDTAAINCALLRAQAIIDLLQCQFTTGDAERASNQTIECALWAITGYLDQLKILTKS